MNSPIHADPRAIESLLAFWADAGVEALYADAPADRARRIDPAEVMTTMVSAQPRPPPVASASAPDALADTRRRAAAAAAEAADLAALGQAIAAFDGCPLKSAGARQAVFARGAACAAVMVIGEAPGAEEDLRGTPFVGRAGQLLDRMLVAAGLADHVFITNTVFWRPPGNRTPTPEEQAVCAPFLERAIALLDPKLLLLVGGAAAKAVLGRSEGILALRGRWFEWRSADGQMERPALPTLHPAFLLRQPIAKKKSWADLLILVERMNRDDRPA